ncbi:MAG: hypothetical protein ACYTG0_30120 [Planctomycetota bacterium]|jgi:hypothetical protein
MAFDKTRYKSLRKRFEQARDTMMAGNLPDRMKITAYHITSFAHPSHDFEWSYAISAELARRVGVSERMIARYIRAFEELGIFQIERCGPTQMSAMLVSCYGRGLPKGARAKRRFNGFQITWQHAVWQTGNLCEEDFTILRGIIGSGRQPVKS